MRNALRGVLTGFSALIVTSASALDCTKAVSEADKAICGSPSANKADETMAKTYFALLSSIQNLEFKDALIASQRHWLKERGRLRAGQYPIDDEHADLAKVLEQATVQRNTFLSKRVQGGSMVVATMTKQLALLRLHPGKFAGFGTACSFVSANPAEDIEYFCPPTSVLQRETRLCRHDLIWASGHTMMYGPLHMLRVISSSCLQLAKMVMLVVPIVQMGTVMP